MEEDKQEKMLMHLFPHLRQCEECEVNGFYLKLVSQETHLHVSLNSC